MGKAGVVCRLVHMQLCIGVGVCSTRVKILGGKKTRLGKSIYWGGGRGGCHKQ